MAINKIVLNTEAGEQVLVDLTGDTVKPYRLAAGCTAHDAAGNPITGVLEIITPKIHLDQGVMYAPGANAYYTPRTITDFSVNFYYYGASGCEQIVYPITGLAIGHTYTIEFEETYNGTFIGDAYQYGCGVMQEAEYNATVFPVNAGKLSCVTWTIASTGTHKGSVTFTANTTKAYWVWNMSRCSDGTRHDITFSTKFQAAGLTLQDKTVTQNGTVTADKGYSGLGTVTVNVPQKEVKLQDKTATENGYVTADSGYDGLGTVLVDVPTSSAKLQSKNVTITSNGTHNIYPDSGYDGLNQVGVTVNVAASGGGYNGVYTNTLCTSIGDSTFIHCDALTSVTYTNATSIGEDAFYSCDELTTVKFPVVASVGARAFQYCSKLSVADFSSPVSIDKTAFNGCSSLSALILRSNTISTVLNSTAFFNTPIQSGTGYIYVPASLVNAYNNADGWWNFQGKFRALESYTVDGTTTGALDPSKI